MDELVTAKNKCGRIIRLALSLVNGCVAAYITVHYEGENPMLLLMLLVDAAIVLEHALLSRGKALTYTLLGSALYFNNSTIYLILYSIYRLSLFDLTGGRVDLHRGVFIFSILICIMLTIALGSIKDKLKETINARSTMLQVYFPLVSLGIMLSNVLTMSNLQHDMLSRKMELCIYVITLSWGLSALASSYIIVFYNIYSSKYEKSLTSLKERFNEKTELMRQASINPLTGLLNREAWKQEVENELLSGDGGCMILLDLDNFKLVNDNFGHPEGDRILIESAEIMRDTFGWSDILGHLSGDEFAVFLRGCLSKEIVEQRLNSLKIRRTRKFYAKNGDSFTLSFSAGYVFVSEKETEYELLMKKADTALYKQKEDGKNGFTLYTDDMKVLQGGGVG